MLQALGSRSTVMLSCTHLIRFEGTDNSSFDSPVPKRPAKNDL